MDIGLSKEQLERRKQGIGGSDANILMRGEREAILKLWGQKRGEIQDDDLSDVLPVQMGHWTEELNVRWFAKKTGFHVKHRNLECLHEEHAIIMCTLDGVAILSDGEEVVLECKHVNPFGYTMDRVVDDYYPQLQHNMFSTGMKRAAISVFIGNLLWEYSLVNQNPEYQQEMLKRELAFWECVKSGRIPDFLDAIDPPGRPGAETMDMTASQEWATYAQDWLGAERAVKRFDGATKSLKRLVPKGTKVAYGCGIRAVRSKSGSIRISVDKG